MLMEEEDDKVVVVVVVMVHLYRHDRNIDSRSRVRRNVLAQIDGVGLVYVVIGQHPSRCQTAFAAQC